MTRAALRDARKSFGLSAVLRRASLSVSEGERVVVLGANGCGKSTLLQLVAGVLEPSGGRVEVNGAIGFAPEKPDIPEHLLVVEWLDLVASLKRARRRRPAELGVEELLSRKVGALSLGQRQRVSLAAAWIGDPALLVLDEPTNGLDAASRDALLARLRGATALVATHDRDLAERIGTRVVTMENGSLTS